MANIMKVNSPAVVTCMGLTKIYQTGIVALNDLTLTIEPGMSFGLMGENDDVSSFSPGLPLFSSLSVQSLNFLPLF